MRNPNKKWTGVSPCQRDLFEPTAAKINLTAFEDVGSVRIDNKSPSSSRRQRDLHLSVKSTV